MPSISALRKSFISKHNNLLTIIHLRETTEIPIDQTLFKIINVFNTNIDDQENILQSVKVSDATVLFIPKKYSVNSGDLDFFKLLKNYISTLVICCDKNANRKQINYLNKDFLCSLAKVCNVSLLNTILKSMKLEVNKSMLIRPFIISNTVSIFPEKKFMIVDGYLRNGLVSDVLLVNGKVEAKILESEFEDQKNFSAEELFLEISNEENLFDTFEDLMLSIDEKENRVRNSIVSDNNSDVCLDHEEGDVEVTKEKQIALNNVCNHSSEIFDQFKCIEEINYLDNLKTSPDYYKNLVFFRNIDILEKRLKKAPNKFSNYTKIKAKILLSEELLNEIKENKFNVFYNLWKYECMPTICNYDFETEIFTGQPITINNGFSVCTYHNYFLSKNESNSTPIPLNTISGSLKLKKGTISFIGRLSLFSNKARIIGTDEYITNYHSSFKDFVCSRTLTGAPIKIQEKNGIFKDMFCCFPRCKMFEGRSIISDKGFHGIIVKTIGTKGHFKVLFNENMNQGEMIKLKMYKRVYLR